MKRKGLAVAAAAAAVLLGIGSVPVTSQAAETESVPETASAEAKTNVKDASIIGFEDRYVVETYDGNAHGLYAGVYNTNGVKFADATLYYVGVDNKYFSTEKPVNAGTYQVTASYLGDACHLPAVDVYAMLVINKAPEAVVQIDDVTTVLGSTDPIEYTYTTTGVAAKDIDTILESMECDGDDTQAGQHPIVGTVDPETADNYAKVTVIPGTHTITDSEESENPENPDPEEPNPDTPNPEEPNPDTPNPEEPGTPDSEEPGITDTEKTETPDVQQPNKTTDKVTTQTTQTKPEKAATTAANASKENTAPKTGDNSVVVGAGVSMAVALLVLVSVFLGRKKYL